jgi:PAS domain S-box-containing protein
MNRLTSIIKYSKKLKLLYVEDNQNAREATMMIFNKFFNEIIVAVDGQEAIEKFEDSIDLIITDINMPRKNGLDMTKTIREIDKDIPILILSAYNESGYFIESIKLGVNGYLLKPLDLEQFLSEIDKIIKKVNLAEEARDNLNLLRQYQEITDKSTIVSKTDLKGNIIYVNDTFCEISAYSQNELVGNSHKLIRHPSNSSSTYADMWETIKEKKSIWQGTLRNISKNGKNYYLRSTIKPILDTDNEIIEYISIQDDITDIMSQKKQLNDLVDSIDQPIIILFKIDRFEDIEKFYGLELSLKIEVEFGDNFFEALPKDFNFNKFFSLGDGEYALIKNQNHCNLTKKELKNELLYIQEKIKENPLEITAIDYDLNVIISLAYGNNAYENAKYGIKKLLQDKQDFILADDLIEKEKEEAQNNLQKLKIIKKALDSSNITTYYQAIINNKTQKVEKYETLARLINEDNKVLTPYHFLDTSKKSKYYSEITSTIIDQAFETLVKTDKSITINLSVIDLEKQSTRKKIFKLLTIHKKDAHRIVFELLEDEDIKDFSLVKSFIQKVKAFGVKIAIDDFGSGYSNFERLLDYKPDILKIDGSLIKNIENDTFSLNVVETIVSFAKKQNIQTVGEFVENENIFNILKDIGVDYSQGYFFAKPEPKITL